MMKLAKLLIRVCLGVLVVGVVSPALVLVSVAAKVYDKHLVDSA